MSTLHTNFTFTLRLSEDEYQRFYRGTAHNIVVMSHQGVSLQFPASAVRPFVQSGGIHGNFIITMNAKNKLVSIKQLSL